MGSAPRRPAPGCSGRRGRRAGRSASETLAGPRRSVARAAARSAPALPCSPPRQVAALDRGADGRPVAERRCEADRSSCGAEVRGTAATSPTARLPRPPRRHGHQRHTVVATAHRGRGTRGWSTARRLRGPGAGELTSSLRHLRGTGRGPRRRAAALRRATRSYVTLAEAARARRPVGRGPTVPRPSLDPTPARRLPADFPVEDWPSHRRPAGLGRRRGRGRTARWSRPSWIADDR